MSKILYQGVYERRYCAACADYYQGAYQNKQDKNRQKPPFSARSHKPKHIGQQPESPACPVLSALFFHSIIVSWFIFFKGRTESIFLLAKKCFLLSSAGLDKGTTLILNNWIRSVSILLPAKKCYCSDYVNRYL